MSTSLERLLQETGCATKEELTKFISRAQVYIVKTINSDVNEMIDDVTNADHISPALNIILKVQKIDSDWVAYGKSKFGEEMKPCLKKCPLQQQLFNLLIESLNCNSLCEVESRKRRKQIEEAAKIFAQSL